MLKALLSFAAAALIGGITPTLAAETPAPKGGVSAPKDVHLYFVWPSDGTVIHGGKFWLRMGLRGMGVAPKGVNLPNVGHHHLLIDTEIPPVGEPIPSDRNHLHFGAGETEARIELPPGKHTLQLVLGDRDHMVFDPPVYSKKITVIVK
ncbi:MAG: DUF4399 domain-containing protein [Burkholderiales bacterium]|nr:DUF4399 domain-containing protein [Burkholderiales bacterium]